jgi:hypothetical protein
LGSDNFGTGWKVFRGYFNADALEDILLYNGAGGSGNTATMKVYFANGTGGWTHAYDSGGGPTAAQLPGPRGRSFRGAAAASVSSERG